MKTVGSYEAKTHLPRLLDEVAAGESITITKHGVPVARLVPLQEAEGMSVEQAIQEIRDFRRSHKLEGTTIRELIDAGRRY